ncbi:MAG: hypothetical protein AAGD88_17170 [Bacteroidota bacterium]
MEFIAKTQWNMKQLITQCAFFLVLYAGFSQSEIKVLSHEDYHTKSVAFIQYLKNGGDFNDLSIWYEGKIQDGLTEKLHRLNAFSNKNPAAVEISTVPNGKLPTQNSPLVMYYLLVDKKEKTEFGLFLGYLADGNLLIDDIKTLEQIDTSKAQESKKAKSDLIPPPPPPPNSKGKH